MEKYLIDGYVTLPRCDRQLALRVREVLFHRTKTLIENISPAGENDLCFAAVVRTEAIGGELALVEQAIGELAREGTVCDWYVLCHRLGEQVYSWSREGKA